MFYIILQLWLQIFGLYGCYQPFAGYGVTLRKAFSAVLAYGIWLPIWCSRLLSALCGISRHSEKGFLNCARIPNPCTASPRLPCETIDTAPNERKRHRDRELHLPHFRPRELRPFSGGPPNENAKDTKYTQTVDDEVTFKKTKFTEGTGAAATVSLV